MAEPSRLTTTPEAEVPGASGPGAGVFTGSEDGVEHAEGAEDGMRGTSRS